MQRGVGTLARTRRSSILRPCLYGWLSHQESVVIESNIRAARVVRGRFYGLNCGIHKIIEVNMPRIKDLIDEAESLPVEERTLIIDKLLKSINPIDTKIEDEWLRLAKQRLSEIRSGSVKLVDGEEIFKKIKDRFEL